MEAKRYSLHALGEAKVGGRRKHGIAAENYEHFGASLLHVLDQIRERLEMIDSPGFDWGRISHSTAHIVKLVIQGVRQQVNGRWLAIAGDNGAAAAVLLEIFGDGDDPSRM